MASIRQRKLADQIKKLISIIVNQKIKDPEKGFITITHVKMSGDLRIASVYFTAYGDAKARETAQRVLDRAGNFIRSEVSANLSLRYVPELRFFLDDTFEEVEKIEKLLNEIHSKKK